MPPCQLMAACLTGDLLACADKPLPKKSAFHSASMTPSMSTALTLAAAHPADLATAIILRPANDIDGPRFQA